MTTDKQRTSATERKRKEREKKDKLKLKNPNTWVHEYDVDEIKRAAKALREGRGIFI